VRSLFRHIALAAILAVAAAAPAHAADFLKAIEDIPVPAGMTEKAEPDVFESNQGRIVRTSISGAVPCNDVEAFYARTLPALGWTLQPEKAEGVSLRFKRDTEQLTLVTLCVTGEAQGLPPTTLSFELVVKLASTRLAE